MHLPTSLSPPSFRFHRSSLGRGNPFFPLFLKTIKITSRFCLNFRLQFVASTFCDLDFCHRFPSSSSASFYFLQHVPTRNNLSKNNVFSIEPRSWHVCYEKLASICIFTSICHRQNSRP